MNEIALVSRAKNDAGSAALEFLTVGLLLLVPMIYLVIVLSEIQSASLAVEGATRQAARVAANSATIAQGSARAQQTIKFALADFGKDKYSRKVSISCLPAGRPCLVPGGGISVSLSVRVPLPFVPDVLDIPNRLAVPVSSVAASAVSRFASEK